MMLLPDTEKTFPPWYPNDTWYFRDLGITAMQADTQVTFTFKRIQQPWLKALARHYIYLSSINKTSHFVHWMVNSITAFSQYLVMNNQHVQTLQDISRACLIGYYAYLVNKGNAATTRHQRIIGLSQFFTVCQERGWGCFSEKLIYAEDTPRRTLKVPRFIPDSVMQQLNAVLDELDPHISRIIRVLQETGVRITELVTLPFACIYQDNEGDYLFKYFQSKLNKEHVIPISLQLANTIKEQQQQVIKEWVSHDLLFPTPKAIKFYKHGIQYRTTRHPGQKWARRTLANHLDKFAQTHKIKGPNGEDWNFTFHAFRHTVATTMINHDVPQHIIQRFLGHESPAMTARYATIHDETLKKAFAEFKGKIVTIAGNVLNPLQIATDIAEGTEEQVLDARWLKKNLMAQALPNGLCALPAISNHCPHANACLTCVNFRTDARYLDIHKAQLAKTKTIIQQAETNGWQRQREMNQAIEINLNNIVTALEKSHDPHS